MHDPNEMCIGKWSCRASVFLPSSDLSLSKSYEGEKLIRGWIIFWWHWSWGRLISLKFCTLSSKQANKAVDSNWQRCFEFIFECENLPKSYDLKRNTICPGFATQRPSSIKVIFKQCPFYRSHIESRMQGLVLKGVCALHCNTCAAWPFEADPNIPIQCWLLYAKKWV